jgi:hypothetical protein
MMSVLQRMPHVYNYPVDLTAKEASRLYAIGVSLIIWMKLQAVALFALLSWRQIEAALNRTSAVDAWIVPVAITLNLATAVFHVMRMRKARRPA